MSFMEENEIFNMGFSRASYTLSNNRSGKDTIWKRLDRLLVNGEYSKFSSSIFIVHLARHPSNHAPLKILFASHLDNRLKPFQFLNVWTAKSALLKVIGSV